MEPVSSLPPPPPPAGALRVHVCISDAAIDVGAGAAAVASPAAGGLASFVGTTRGATARGARVRHLEFEAHAPLAAAELRRAAAEAQAAARGALIGVHVAHRTGVVRVGEAAVCVWVSAPHRAEALAACRFMIDALKARAPIWKKEVLEDGTAAWRENAECAGCATAGARAPTTTTTTAAATTTTTHECEHEQERGLDEPPRAAT
jgi:molybdopterin synthase catalytic subunit